MAAFNASRRQDVPAGMQSFAVTNFLVDTRLRVTTFEYWFLSRFPNTFTFEALYPPAGLAGWSPTAQNEQAAGSICQSFGAPVPGETPCYGSGTAQVALSSTELCELGGLWSLYLRTACATGAMVDGAGRLGETYPDGDCSAAPPDQQLRIDAQVQESNLCRLGVILPDLSLTASAENRNVNLGSPFKFNFAIAGFNGLPGIDAVTITRIRLRKLGRLTDAAGLAAVPRDPALPGATELIAEGAQGRAFPGFERILGKRSDLRIAFADPPMSVEIVLQPTIGQNLTGSWVEASETGAQVAFEVDVRLRVVFQNPAPGRKSMKRQTVQNVPVPKLAQTIEQTIGVLVNVPAGVFDPVTGQIQGASGEQPVPSTSMAEPVPATTATPFPETVPSEVVATTSTVPSLPTLPSAPGEASIPPPLSGHLSGTLPGLIVGGIALILAFVGVGVFVYSKRKRLAKQMQKEIARLRVVNSASGEFGSGGGYARLIEGADAVDDEDVELRGLDAKVDDRFKLGDDDLEYAGTTEGFEWGGGSHKG